MVMVDRVNINFLKYLAKSRRAGQERVPRLPAPDAAGYGGQVPLNYTRFSKQIYQKIAA
jgi:hypothetical protein